jgi:hypothetical protein
VADPIITPDSPMGLQNSPRPPRMREVLRTYAALCRYLGNGTAQREAIELGRSGQSGGFCNLKRVNYVLLVVSFSWRPYCVRDRATAELSACVLSFTYVWICRWLPAYARPVESAREESLGQGISYTPAAPHGLRRLFRGLSLPGTALFWLVLHRNL